MDSIFFVGLFKLRAEKYLRTGLIFWFIELFSIYFAVDWVVAEWSGLRQLSLMNALGFNALMNH